jgi:hypothetical protein
MADVKSVADAWKAQVLEMVATEGTKLIPFEPPGGRYRTAHIEVEPGSGVGARIMVIGHHVDRPGEELDKGEAPYKVAITQLEQAADGLHVMWVRERLVGGTFTDAQEAAKEVTTEALRHDCACVVVVSTAWNEPGYLKPLLALLPDWVRIVLWARQNLEVASLVGLGINAQLLTEAGRTPFLELYGNLEGQNLSRLCSFARAAGANYMKRKTLLMKYGSAIARMGTQSSAAGTFARHGWVMEYRDHGLVREAAKQMVEAWRARRGGALGRTLSDAVTAFTTRAWKVRAHSDESVARSMALTMVLSAAGRIDEADVIGYQCQEGTIGWCAGCAAVALLGQRLPVVCEADDKTMEGSAELFLLSGRPGQLADIRHAEVVDEEQGLALMWWCNCGTMRLSLTDPPEGVEWRPQHCSQGDVEEHGLCARFLAGHADPALNVVTIVRPLELSDGEHVWLAWQGEMVDRERLRRRLRELGSTAARRVDDIWRDWAEIHPPDNWAHLVCLLRFLDEPEVLGAPPGPEVRRYLAHQMGGGSLVGGLPGLVVGNHGALTEGDLIGELALELSMTGIPMVLLAVGA